MRVISWIWVVLLSTLAVLNCIEYLITSHLLSLIASILLTICLVVAVGYKLLIWAGQKTNAP